jgi:hypothetical protein
MRWVKVTAWVAMALIGACGSSDKATLLVVEDASLPMDAGSDETPEAGIGDASSEPEPDAGRDAAEDAPPEDAGEDAGPDADAAPPRGPPLTFDLDGDPTTLCGDDFFLEYVPTIATGAGQFVIGCSPYGDVAPVLSFVHRSGEQFASPALRKQFFQYYRAVRLSYFDGMFQALNSYTCLDDESWGVGHGWTCLEFKIFDATGSVVAAPIPFGETGVNEHPGLAFNGTTYAAAWIRYDDVYLRLIDRQGNLVGADPFENVFLAHDPVSSDARWGSRTRIVWDGQSWAIFSGIGENLYFLRASESGTLEVGPLLLGPIMAQAWLGELAVVTTSTGHYVLYHDQTDVRLNQVSRDGEILKSIQVPSGGCYYPSLLEIQNQFYVFSHDVDLHPTVAVFDADLEPISGAGGVISTAVTAYCPQVAQDPQGAPIAMAYTQSQQTNGITFQRLQPIAGP